MAESRVSVVTGGALGIGGAVSRRLAHDGDHIVLVDVDEPAATATADEIVAAGGRVTPLVGDVTAAETVERLAAVVADIGQVDVLVNNVGDFRPASKTFLHSTPEQWQRLHELNFHHVLAVTHALLPRMVDRGRGAIVNCSTVEAFRGIPGHAAYSGYNAAVSAFTKSLAVEVGRHGVRVNAIAPDLADTYMMQQNPQEAVDAMVGGTLVKRLATPDEMVGPALLLCSDAGSYMTGSVIIADGGGTPR